MKKVRLLSIVLLTLLLGVLFVNRDRLVSFAKENDVNMLNDMSVIKNNTSFLFEDYIQIGGNSARCLVVEYRNKDLSYISSDEVCTSQGITNMHLEISNDASEFWLIDDLYIESTTGVLVLVPFEYEGPEFYLECSPDKITMDSYATCTVTADTYFNMSKIEYDLNLDDFIIYDEKALEDVEDLDIDEHHYVLTPKQIRPNGATSSYDEYAPFDEAVNVKLMEFKIKTEKDQDVAVLGNIKLTDLNYTDPIGESPYEILTSTVGQDMKEEVAADNKEKENGETNGNNAKNPGTADIIVGVAVLLVVSFVVIMTATVKHKKIS